jgi:GNAT superfamily N-acetyltransferase
MKIKMVPCKEEDDFWRIRNFLREVFLLNGRVEDSWHVARWDYWRWHYIKTCQICEPFDKVTATWQTEDGSIIAVLHPIGGGEVRLHIHPEHRSPELEDEAFAYAENNFFDLTGDGRHFLLVPVVKCDTLRQNVLSNRGFEKQPGWGHHYWQDLATPLPSRELPAGYEVRSMGMLDEHPSRCWASWRAFHPNEPDEEYSGYSWYQNLQSAPLYRRDLDIVAIAPNNEIAAFCTIFYDDYSRSAVTVVVGTAAEYWRQGLGKAVMIEGMRRLKELGCTRVFSTAHDEPAEALYGSLMNEMRATDTWVKVI